MKRRAFHLGILASALFMAGSLSAQSMRIDVSGVGARQVPLALAPFNGAGQAPQQLDVVIREDLQRSGMFRLVNLTETLSENSPLDMSALRGQGADSVLVGPWPTPDWNSATSWPTPCASPSSPKPP